VLLVAAVVAVAISVIDSVTSSSSSLDSSSSTLDRRELQLHVLLLVLQCAAVVGGCFPFKVVGS
jgi:hypothetical protein